MKIKMILVIIILSLFYATSNITAQETTVNATIISSTSLDDSLPYQIIDGKSWNAEKDAEYVRLDILFDRGIKLGGLEVEFGNVMKSNVTIYLDDLDQTYYAYPNDNKIVQDIGYNKSIKSVKFNFGMDKSVTIKNIVLYDKNKKKINIHTSKVIEGSAKVSSTLEPSRFYDIMKIFDSKLENGWSSNKQKSGDVLEFNFDKPLTITSMKIWNGYQRSEVHYAANSRVKTLRIEDGKNYSQTLSLPDMIGAQDIKLPVKFTGDYLKITIIDSYVGKDYKDLVISELRFFDGKDYILINPVKFLKENINYNRNQFMTAGVENLLNSEAGYETYEDGGNGYLLFRLRSDGSMYCQGNIAKGEKSKNYFLIGNYEILKSYNEGADLRLFGYIVTQEGTGTFSEGGGDCGGGGYDYVYKKATKKIFTEYITIKKSERANYYLFTNTGKIHNLNFNKAEFYLHE